MTFVNIKFPNKLEYSSDTQDIPLDFYLQVVPKSKVIYLKLGYFSSSAFRVLAYGFAQFIYRGGRIKIVTNHFLYSSDKQLLDTEEPTKSDCDKAILSNLMELKESLTSESEQFINCLQYLIKNKRLEIIPVMLLPNRMTHYKQGIFVDKDDNIIAMDGSCNFTANGIIGNAETISPYRSWESEYEITKVNSKKEDILSICNKENSMYKYLDSSHILDAVSEIGEDKTIEELLSDELQLLNNKEIQTNAKVLEKYKNEIEKIISIEKTKPKFPFASGPREYQKQAFINWADNNYQGVFSMATGTGKTITSLNCLLNVYNNDGYYQAIILVPTQTLINQWVEELKSFNFQNIILVSSEFPNWRKMLPELITNLKFNKSKSFVIVAIYDSFSLPHFQKHFKNLPKSCLFIADEAHNLGAPKVKSSLEELHLSRRIALSATLTRQFDIEGNELIEKVFNSSYPYTYNFSMKRAIQEDVLCQYDYFPHIVYLNEEEFSEYIDISRELMKYFDFEKGTYKASPYISKLQMDRKRIIYKAEDKLPLFKRIIQEHFKENLKLSNSFVYVPEGNDGDKRNILDKFLNAFEEIFPNLRAYAYTGATPNKKEVLERFETGFIDSLFAMKCLDEGVDIPRAELAIFCSSTGNPKQFIQRRGRVLRTHPDKTHAVIHDMIVIPRSTPDKDTLKYEKKVLTSELERVVYFASLAKNYYHTMDKFKNITERYDINLYDIQESIEEKQ